MRFKLGLRKFGYSSALGVFFLTLNMLLPASVNMQSPLSEPEYLPIYSHIGIINPLLEKWEAAEVYPSNGIRIGPIYDNGEFAWQIDDDSPSKMFTYFVNPSEREVMAAKMQGWRLNTRIRLVDFPDPKPGNNLAEDASPIILFRDGTRSFQVHFLTTADGKLSIYLLKDLTAGRRDGFAIEVPGSISRYHEISLVYNPITKRAAVYANRRLLYSGYTGARFSSPPILMWGAGSTNAIGHANFSQLSFEVNVVPVSVPNDAEMKLSALLERSY